ncbi:MAG TPA: peptidoglycan DD-metalloendopeptidase family protein [Chitinophagales bacterium]
MKSLKKEIADMEAKMQATTKKRRLTEQEVTFLKTQITEKEKQISGFKRQVGSLGKNIQRTTEEIENKNESLEDLKKRYAFLLREIYKNATGGNDVNSPLFASSEHKFIEQNYLSRLAQYRKLQAQKVQGNIEQLEYKKEDLESTKRKTEATLVTEANRQKQLQADQEKKTQEAAKLSKQEKLTRAQIIKKNKAAQELNKEIQKIIEREIQRAKDRAAEAARRAAANKNTTSTKTAPKTETYLTPLEMALSQGFANNQGRLPWPVAKGTVVSEFGRHEHPTIKEIFIENNGIDLKTIPGGQARAAFEGTVVTIFNLPTTQNCIMIKHGEFFTVYSNIVTPSVNVGDKVIAKQNIGSIYTDPNDNSTKLHFEIWRGKDKLNPSYWIAPAN